MLRKQTETRRNFMKAVGVAAGGVWTEAVAAGAERRAAAEINKPRTHNFDVTAFGAKGDGKAIDTPAINKAIEAAAAAGGGTVVFPAGTYLSYSIHLKSMCRSSSPMVPR